MQVTQTHARFEGVDAMLLLGLWSKPQQRRTHSHVRLDYTNARTLRWVSLNNIIVRRRTHGHAHTDMQRHHASQAHTLEEAAQL